MQGFTPLFIIHTRLLYRLLAFKVTMAAAPDAPNVGPHTIEPHPSSLGPVTAEMDIRQDSGALLSFVSIEYLLSAFVMATLVAQLIFDFEDPRWWTVHYCLFIPTIGLLAMTLDVLFLAPPIARWLSSFESHIESDQHPTSHADIELAALGSLPTPSADSASGTTALDRWTFSMRRQSLKINL